MTQIRSPEPTGSVVVLSRACEAPSLALSDISAWCTRAGLAPTGGAKVLRAGLAWEVPCGRDAISSEQLVALREIAAAEQIDCNLVSTTARRKKLLIADMESTVIKEECLDELAAALGIGEKIADITQRAMNAEISFEAALRERVGLLAGLDEGVLAQLRDTGLTIMPGARALVATMRAHGAFCALVSGGFTYFAEPVGTALGFDHVQANRIDIADGRLTGDVIPPILGREAKRTALEAIAADRGVSIGDAVCVGDGANDLAMLKAATELGGIGVAFNAKPAVAREANVRIDHSGLDALLYLQGYREAEVVTPAAA